MFRNTKRKKENKGRENGIGTEPKDDPSELQSVSGNAQRTAKDETR